MGIRYYAYAFEPEMTERAVAHPHSFIGIDPLADAWGVEPGFSSGVIDVRAAPPARDFLYLDKCWRHLQRLTAPAEPDHSPRPAYGMFAGSVRETEEGWIPWTRAVAPPEVVEIAEDLRTVSGDAVESMIADWSAHRIDVRSEVDYVATYLDAARRFVDGLAVEGRGFVYTIG